MMKVQQRFSLAEVVKSDPQLDFKMKMQAILSLLQYSLMYQHCGDDQLLSISPLRLADHETV
jgi:hypothetical protein